MEELTSLPLADPIPITADCLSSTNCNHPPVSANISSGQCPSVQPQDKETGKQNTNTDVNGTEEWIVVTEKKKKAAKAKEIKINNNKHKSRNMTAKNGNRPNKRTVSSVPFVKEQEDVPFLSDNESITESSCSSDFHPTKYYSPFSTGFDLFPISKQKTLPQQPVPIHSRLDEYLSSQQAHYKQYTQKNSILNLLIQSDQVETIMTPTCFKYFDDMMMSTSLYPTNEDVSFSSIINKRDWDSFSR